MAKDKRRKRRPAVRRKAAVPAPPRAGAPSRSVDTETVGAGSSDLVIVGVGASAGGLEAFSQLLQALPPKPGFSMVLVQHLAPQHESALAVLLSGRTDLPVVQATEGVRVEQNHVYVIPPNVQMGIRNERLHLSPRPSDPSQYTPIDFFLRSLADSVQERAIAVILSGTASDGTGGVREVKSVGGITIAQTPDSAKYDGMPRSAIATNLVDLVLSPPEIAKELVHIASHPLRRHRGEMPIAGAPDDAVAPREEHLEQVFTMLRAATGVDFRRYKRPTIERRLQRRMVLNKVTRIDQYLKLLRENSGEVQSLYQDILIHVTRFFREPDSFAAIGSHLLPKLLENQRDDQPIRVWVPGCSTGEEAYSVAIVLLESLGERAGTVPIQVFATDISNAAIEHARTGLYPETIASDVSAERLRRFFSKVDGGHRVNRPVRDLCVFARQDLTRDPPFSKLDLILCRNVLIYMGAELQRKLMSVFHYALKPTGFLVLGAAETIGLHSELFGIADKKHRIYQKKPVSAAEVHLPLDYAGAVGVGMQVRRDTAAARDDVKSVQSEANRVIQERYAPPGVIVDANLHVVQFRGQTGAFLEPPPGDPSTSLLKMAREGLLHGLRSAVQEARRTKTAVRRKGIRVRSNGGWRATCLEVVPLAAAERPHFLILFHADDGTSATVSEPVGAARGRQRRGRTEPASIANGHVARLEQELASSREYLQSIIQELEAANEELQSANEEVLSANEELQSTNEELDTAKEELQSTNEELNTVNEELHGRNEELSRLNSDLMNLLGSVQIAIVIVSADLRIRRFTPMAERVLNLIPADVGRPIGHIKPNIDCPDLEEQIVQVIDTVTPLEHEVRDGQGTLYSLRIRPYKNVENRIEGAVLALFDLQRDQLPKESLRRAHEYVQAMQDMVRHPLVVLDRGLRVRAVNPAFCDAFATTPAESEGRPFGELGDGQWNLPRLRAMLEEVAETGRPLDGVQIGGDSAPGFLLAARRMDDVDGGNVLLLALERANEGAGR
jgi:two-component system CheB/CheR fusion protein